MEHELFQRYDKLSNNDKRNELNEEMIKLFELVNQMTKAKGYQGDNSTTMHNYDSVGEKNISESEYLSMTYKNFINIRKCLINYISWKE